MELRYYQRGAVDACYDFLRRRDDNPCIVCPTGGGKTPIIATICRDAVEKWGGRVLVLAHVKELLEQAADKLAKVCPGIPVGIYSAGLGKRQTKEPVIVAGIQSIYKHALDVGTFNLVLVDEAHLIPPPKGEDEGEGMYRTFLREAKLANPTMRVIGLTATPYRMTTGTICGPENILNEVCYEIGVKELIRDGFLCPVRSKAGKVLADLGAVHVRGGEYIEGELQNAMLDPAVLQAAVDEIAAHSASRTSTLIFSCGMEHAKAIATALEAKTEKRVECIFGSTSADRRKRLLEEFKRREFPYLVNINVLTTGFDAPNIDCIGMLRPTLSPGLYYQMVGRGLRLDPGKSDCLVLDFGQNVNRHGPIDCIHSDGKARGSGAASGEAPAKTCPECQEQIAAGFGRCPACGFAFPERRGPKHSTSASNAPILSQDVVVEDCQVYDVEYSAHWKKGTKEGDPGAVPTMRVTYRIGLVDTISEWVCFEHKGFALSKARLWWSARSDWACPETVERALELCEDGAVAQTHVIKVRRVAGEKFPEVVGFELGPRPKDGEYLEPENVGVIPAEEGFEDDIPF